MKVLTILALVSMMAFTVSCGDKDKSSKSSNTFSNNLSTQNGYYNTQTQALEIGSQVYPPSQQYATVMNQAIMNARNQNIQPVMVNGVQKFRARITAQMISNQYNNQYNQQYQQPPQQYSQYNQPMLNITSVQFY